MLKKDRYLIASTILTPYIVFGFLSLFISNDYTSGTIAGLVFGGHMLYIIYNLCEKGINFFTDKD